MEPNARSGGETVHLGLLKANEGEDYNFLHFAAVRVCDNVRRGQRHFCEFGLCKGKVIARTDTADECLRLCQDSPECLQWVWKLKIL